MADEPEGWGPLLWGQRKFHYFRGFRSLCGHWGTGFPDEELQPDDGTPNSSECSACRKKLSR